MARIMVIDDDDTIRGLLRSALSAEGHEVVTVPNGKEGQRSLQKKPADLVITDLFMPEQEGLETIRMFRKEFPETRIIAISGGGNTGKFNFLPAAKAFGACRTFSKPIDLNRFIETVNELLT